MEVGHGWPLLIETTEVITNWSRTLQSFFYDWIQPWILIWKLGAPSVKVERASLLRYKNQLVMSSAILTMSDLLALRITCLTKACCTAHGYTIASFQATIPASASCSTKSLLQEINTQTRLAIHTTRLAIHAQHGLSSFTLVARPLLWWTHTGCLASLSWLDHLSDELTLWVKMVAENEYMVCSYTFEDKIVKITDKDTPGLRQTHSLVLLLLLYQ